MSERLTYQTSRFFVVFLCLILVVAGCDSDSESSPQVQQDEEFVADEIPEELLESSAVNDDQTQEAEDRDRSNLPTNRLAIGHHHVCAIFDGTIDCWGSDRDEGLLNAPEGTFRQISADAWRTCAIRTDDQLKCWGKLGGELVRLPAWNFRQVSAGDHVCAILMDGEVSCWAGEHAMRPEEWEVPDEKFQTLSASIGGYLCGITVEGEVECWGWQAFDGATEYPSSGSYRDVDNTHPACAVKETGAVTCWAGDLPTAPEESFRQISIHDNYACGITKDDELHCWGEFPTDDAPPTGSFREVQTGRYVACAVDLDDEVHCWGSNEHGQLDSDRIRQHDGTEPSTEYADEGEPPSPPSESDPSPSPAPSQPVDERSEEPADDDDSDSTSIEIEGNPFEGGGF